MTDTQPTATLRHGEIPLLGFGTFRLGGNDAYRCVRTALDVGYRHIDTATGYGNEEQVGRAIADSGIARGEIFLTTKLPPEDAGNERSVIGSSLSKLGMDYVDLWLIHWPPSGAGVDTWREFIAVQGEGQAHAIGVSNYSPEQIDELIDATGMAPEVNQIRWAPALFDEKRLAHSRERGVVLEGYSPLKASNLNDPTLAEIAQTHAVTVPQVILRWHIEHGIVAIPKSVTAERIRSNFDLFGFELSADEVARIDGLSKI